MEEEALEVHGVVRVQGSKYAGSGLERVVIHLEKGDDDSTPNPHSVRVPITLAVNQRRYAGGLLLRKQPPPFASLSPDLIDEDGNPTNLAAVLQDANIVKNKRVALELSGLLVTLAPL